MGRNSEVWGSVLGSHEEDVRNESVEMYVAEFSKGSVNTPYKICMSVLDFGQCEPIGMVMVNALANFLDPLCFLGTNSW